MAGRIDRGIASVVTGTARVDRRTKDLVHRLRPGEIAVIDHEDLDRIAAEGLIDAGAAAVINDAPCMSGRYPNVGPLLLAAAGIPVLDSAAGVIDRIGEGTPIALVGGQVLVGDERVAVGSRQTMATFEAQLEASREQVDDELERFAANTLEYVAKERALFTETPDIPDLRTEMRGQQILLVVRGSDHREDLQVLRRSGYLTEMRPVVVAVDGGADALLDLGVTPDLIIGDFDSITEAALRCGAELVVHAYPGGDAPGAERLAALGLDYTSFEAPGTSEDVAMLLAYEEGAELIVAVGTHSSMGDFLDKGRKGMASTFLVRLKVGPILVDAKGVSRLYKNRVRKRDLALLVLSALITLTIIVIVSEPIRLILRGFWVTR